MDSQIFFLHGLDSSGSGTKGKFFAKHYPYVHRPDFSGELEQRIQKLQDITKELKDLIFIGSSFGGLMATCYAINSPEKVSKLVLLAPALNFGSYQPPEQKNLTPTELFIGRNDDVTPIDPVVSLAKSTFANLATHISDDDHFLHNTFPILPWSNLLHLKSNSQ